MDEAFIGKTDKFKQANLLAEFGGNLYKVGWIRFAPDGGLYFQFHQTSQLVSKGEVVYVGGLVKSVTEEPLTSLPQTHRVNLHISLHPTGILHVRAGKNPPIIEQDYGPWLPLVQPLLLGHLLSPPIRELATKDTRKFQDRVFAVESLDAGVKATITLLPKCYRPSKRVLMGVSHRYNVGVEITTVTPATPGFSFVKRTKSQ